MEASNARIVLYGECKSGVYLIFFLFLSSMSFGQCCSGGVPLSSAVGLPPAAVGTLQLNINYNWNHLSRLKSGAVLLYDKLRQRNTHAQIVASGYRFSPAISVDIFGVAVSGPNKGAQLKIPYSYMAYWFSLHSFYPQVELYE